MLEEDLIIRVLHDEILVMKNWNIDRSHEKLWPRIYQRVNIVR